MYGEHRRQAKTQASLHTNAVSPMPFLFVVEPFSKLQVKHKRMFVAPIWDCACVFEEPQT